MSERAWAAGLFDGEGSIFASASKRRSHRPPVVRLHMALGMTTEAAVRRFHAVVGVGSVVFLANQKGARKVQWRWQTSGDEGVRHALEVIRPWLSEHKQTQAREALARRDAWLALPKQPRKRKTHCIRGHLLSETLYVSPHGAGRYCRPCARETNRKWKERQQGDDQPLFNYLGEVV